ncbi:MAG: NADH-quinone oxidoreductase subunit [Sphingomonadales bacterium]|jgi:NADH-quinone oxidoreductase subunit M|nr:NADH-quinone oxidoreductase subunit [Sphingomonadales bacterium]
MDASLRWHDELMTGLPILSILLAVPLIAAGACLFVSANAARWIALAATLVDLLLGIWLWSAFEIGGPQWQFVEYQKMAFSPFAWALGIDGIALMLTMLSLFLMPICILASWTTIERRVPEYMAAFLAMETMMIGVFMAQDIFLFYIFFEAGLIPMFLIIGIWGGAERIYASYKFFLYTLLGSVLMLVAMLWMVNFTHGDTYIPHLLATNFPPEAQTWLWLAFFASFAVKMPMWPVHTWLPDAHVQAPTAGSVILAGVLLKLGGYGFVRFSLPMFPEASAQLVWIIFGLSLVAIVYTSLVALVQRDMKKLIAYSSVAHMAFVTIGLFTFNRQGIEGALIMMLSHGLVSGALFLCVGVVYDRLHTREIDRYGGLSNNMPAYALLFMLFTMASVGLPGTSGFVGEFLSLVGAYRASSLVAFVATSGIILGAAYMLYLYWRVAFGTSRNAEAAAMPDLNPRELVSLGAIAAVVLWMGVYPESFLAPMRGDVGTLIARVERAAPPGDSGLVRTAHAGKREGAR